MNSNFQKAIKILARQHFDYKGRKFKYETARPGQEMDLTSFWDGGSIREFVVIYQGKIVEVPRNGSMNDRRNFSKSVLRPGAIMLEHSIFCGKSCGVTCYLVEEVAAQVADQVAVIGNG